MQFSNTDILLTLVVNWLAFSVIPGYLEGIGISIVLVSVTGLAAWDLLVEVGTKRPGNEEHAERSEI